VKIWAWQFNILALFTYSLAVKF